MPVVAGGEDGAVEARAAGERVRGRFVMTARGEQGCRRTGARPAGHGGPLRHRLLALPGLLLAFGLVQASAGLGHAAGHPTHGGGADRVERAAHASGLLDAASAPARRARAAGRATTPAAGRAAPGGAVDLGRLLDGLGAGRARPAGRLLVARGGHLRTGPGRPDAHRPAGSAHRAPAAGPAGSGTQGRRPPVSRATRVPSSPTHPSGRSGPRPVRAPEPAGNGGGSGGHRPKGPGGRGAMPPHRRTGGAPAPGVGCPFGPVRAVFRPGAVPGGCEILVRTAACRPLLVGDAWDVRVVLGAVREHRDRFELTGMAARRCRPAVAPPPPKPSAPRPTPAPAPTARPEPAPRPTPPVVRPAGAPAAPAPPRTTPPPRPTPTPTPLVRRMTPRAAPRRPAGISTAGAVFLVLLPAAAAAVVAGARALSRSR